MDSQPLAWYAELNDCVRGTVYRRGDPSFEARSQIFNGNVRCSAKVVVCPLDAHDISNVVLFCSKHSLSPSIKAGGYGTAGWAVNGDVVVDLSNLLDVHIEPPQSKALKPKGYTSIRDIPVSASKGKGSNQSTSSGVIGKRQREDSVEDEDYQAPARRMRSYDRASLAMASFLSGPPLLPDFNISGEMPRRLPTDIRLPMPPAMDSRQTSSDSSTSNSSGSSLQTVSTSAGTDVTTPDEGDAGVSGVDPFGYMNLPSALGQSVAPNIPSVFSASNLPMPTPATRLSSMPFGADPFGYMDSPASMSMPGGFSMGPGSSSLWTPPSSQQPVAFPPSQHPATQTHSPPVTDSPPAHTLSNSPVHATPVHPHAFVTFGAGVLQKDMDAFTAAHPLEARSIGGERVDVPYHVPSAAHPVGSSIMLLGGFGFLSRLYGLSVDNVVEVEMVLADGQIVVVNEDEHPDLWWALRGAGPAFGIVTRYKARAYPVPVVFAGNLIYRFHRATAPSLIKHFRDCIKAAPRELYANVLLTAGPADQDSLVVIQICYVGPREKGIEFLQAIESWEGERCLLNEVSEKAFVDQQDSVAQVLRARAGRNWFIRSALITSLPDDVINKTVMQFADTPIGCTWLFELAGGAIADFEDSCVPKPQREAAFTVAALHQWEMEIDDPRCRLSAEKWIKESLAPVAAGGSFPSFLGRHEPAPRTISCFGENWGRLCALKLKYDPRNMFKNTFWPMDEGGQSIEPEMHEPPSP